MAQIITPQHIYIYICVCGTFRVYVSILGFSGLNSENSLFYSVLRRPAMFEMAHHKPTKCLFLQYLQLVPAKFLGKKHFMSVNSISHYIFCDFSGSQNCHIDPEGTTHIYIYMYICICICIILTETVTQKTGFRMFSLLDYESRSESKSMGFEIIL